jgi:hypothetical protein
MIVRRLIAGLLSAGLGTGALGATALASGPRPRAARPAELVQLPTMGSRALARADSADEADPTAPSTAPVASLPSPEIAARARAVFDANRVGKIDRSQYTEQMNGRIDDKSLAAAAVQLGSLGDVKSFNQVRKITQGNRTLSVFRIDFVNGGTIEQAIGWDSAGKVAFLQFAPAR